MARGVGPFRNRQRVMLSVVVVVLVGFAARLVYVQGVTGSALAADALSVRLKTEDLQAQRGDILDRNGEVLATSVQRVRVVADQTQVAKFKRTDDKTRTTYRGAEGAAALLAPVLGMDEAALRSSLSGTKRYVVLAKDVSVETWLKVKDLGTIDGVTAEYYSKRVYPAGTVAGNLIGFGYEDPDKPGQTQWAGLEGSQNAALTGTDGTQTVEKGLSGREIPGGTDEVKQAVPGKNVVLTLDEDLQSRTQDLLTQHVASVGASWGSVIIEDVQTGGIVVMADSRTMDPNNPGSGAAQGSLAAQAVFDPGSTAKVITMAALLESGLATPTTQVTAPYAVTMPNGQTFHDSHYHEPENLTLTGVLAESSNTGTVTLGQQLPVQTRYDYLSKFGLGQKTGVGLAESAGILNPVDQWDGRTAYAVMFGQGVAATALQMTQVFATIANGGVRLPMHLVEGTKDSTGDLTKQDYGSGTRVISQETASQLMTMMEATVADGTGKKGAIPGFRVAGKTGTAQAADANGQLTQIVSSFIGIVPADHPRFVITAVIYNPTTSIYASEVAAPLFEQVGSMALQRYGVAPSDSAATLYPTTW